MEKMIYLGDQELVSERSFTDPDHIAADKATLYTIVHNLLRHLGQTAPSASNAQPLFFYFPEEERWQKRILLLNPEAVTVNHFLAFVGFFGQRHVMADPEVVAEIAGIDQELMVALHHTPGIVGYCSFLLADGLNYANLVLMDSEEIASHWRENRLHQRTNELLAHRYYSNVRIYRGTFSCHGQSGPQLQLQRVKYWDFQDTPVWHAVRTLSEH